MFKHLLISSLICSLAVPAPLFAGDSQGPSITPPADSVTSGPESGGDEGLESPPVDAAEEAELHARALYQLGLRLMLDELWEGARQVFEQVVAEYPDSDAAQQAQRSLSDLDLLDAEAPAPTFKVLDDGRAEFIASQTLVGTWVALNTAWLFDVEGAQGYAAASLIGAGGGLLGSALATRERPITEGEALAAYWGQLWTSFNLTLFTLSIEPEAIDSGIFNITNIVGAAGGLPLGLVYQRRFELDAGQTALAFGSGFWGAYGGVMLGLSLGEDLLEETKGRTVLLTSLVAGDAALALGTRLAQDMAISRSRMRLVNLGGYLGALTVGAGLIILQPDLDAIAEISMPLLLGPAAGLSIAWAATRNWDAERHPELFVETPVGALIGVDQGRVGIDGLYPQPTRLSYRDEAGEKVDAMGVTVPVLGARW